MTVGQIVGEADPLGAEQVHGGLDAEIELFARDHLTASRKQGASHQRLGGDHGLQIDGVHDVGADIPTQGVLLLGREQRPGEALFGQHVA